MKSIKKTLQKTFEFTVKFDFESGFWVKFDFDSVSSVNICFDRGSWVKSSILVKSEINFSVNFDSKISGAFVFILDFGVMTAHVVCSWRNLVVQNRTGCPHRTSYSSGVMYDVRSLREWISESLSL